MVDAPDMLPPLSRAESQAIGRRRRGRNWLMLAALIALVGLFFAITMVKISQGTLKF
ncbi:MAG: hypothetical protein NT133_22145 [Alphaproteobacteria bacterium]|nr:hypothetical protein [Alphaproteobacteria bacterium]